MPTPALLEKTRLHVRRHFMRHMPKWMSFHDLEHTLSVTRAAVDIGRASGLTARDLHIVELAALFHDMGYATAYKGHEEASAALVRAYLAEQGQGERLIKQVEALIRSTRMHVRPRNLMQRVLRDADSAKAGQADFDEKSERLRRELEHVLGKRISPKAWTLENIAYLGDHRFHTPYALRRFSAQKVINLRGLQRALEEHRKTDDRTPPTPEPFFDRDLSWLSFNGRVLQEAQDERVPLLERLKFVAIHSSNLDEFYRVRVAQLRGLRKLGKWDRSALEVPPERHIARINRAALKQQAQLGALYRGRLLPALERHGIRFLDERSISASQRDFVLALFRERIAPLLQTAAVRKANAPFIEDRKLYLMFSLTQKGKKKARAVLVNVPSEELGRFIILPARKGRVDLLYLDDAIRVGAASFFKGHTVNACHAIKLSRDADLYLDEEFAESVVDKVRRSLRKRRTGVPARFLYDGAMPRLMLNAVRGVLDVKKQDLLTGGRYHNLSDLMGLPITGHAQLRDKPMPPLPHPALGGARDPFARIREQDRLIHFPYHDFAAFLSVLQRAAKDPAVERISITLYRVAYGSKVCEALLAAARAGKKVTVLMEVQARFDEGNNLYWGDALEKAGARVIYGREGLKVHCKLCLIERRERNKVQRYGYLGTGNFNERTARLYGDIGLWTADPRLTRDLADVFADLSGTAREPRTGRLLIAPGALRAALEQAIDKEIEHALSGRPASILLKLNSLEDKPLIRKLYDASRAGVEVRIIVRGLCCAVPGVRGHSAHIRIISIVDRFLEHARAYVFHNGGAPTLHLASADWMERNMDRRVEVAFPVLDEGLKAEVLRFLELQWSDDQKARVIDAKQSSAYRKPRKGQRAVHAQADWYAALKKAAGAKAVR